VANAVRHAATTLELLLSAGDDGLEISVLDDDRAAPVRRGSVAWDDESGRGLTIVDALSSCWGSEPTTMGKRVWARIGDDVEVAPGHPVAG